MVFIASIGWNVTYEHYTGLVAAVGMLLQSPLKREEIERADELLKYFYRKMTDLYGKFHQVHVMS